MTSVAEWVHRWSRLKRSGARSFEGVGGGKSTSTSTSARANQHVAVVAERPAPVIDSLDGASDYKRFLADDVPADVRRTALRSLWRSDPALGDCDGLIDYAGEYASAAGCDPTETAFRIGRGLLNDDEASAWEAVGRT